MIKKYIILLPIVFLILSYLLISRYIVLDTGYTFAYDYILNKLEINNTKNKISLKNNYKNKKNNENILFEFQNIPGFAPKEIITYDKYNPSNKQLFETNTWTRSNGGNYSNKFSDLNSINKENILKLKLDFKLELNNGKLFKKKWMNNVETNPIFYDGLLYAITPFKELIAVDVVNKKIKWRFKSLKKIDSRGITLWINENDKDKSCIFVPIRNGLFCVNYKSGKLNKSLGNNGFIKTGIVRAAPVIWKDNVVVATVDDQKVKIISLKNGQIIDTINIHPNNRSFRGGSPWGGISFDKKNNLLFLTTGNPRPALIGTSRPGKNKNANSIIAINLEDRKISWTFQEVAHDLWDYDIASPPLLATINLNNKLIDVVIVTTKIGNTLIFNRINGETMHDIEYTSVPNSDYLQEIVSPKQIETKIPESFMRLDFSIDDFDNRLSFEKEKIIKNISDYSFGSFVPPSFKKDVIVYGLHGGAQWPGAVFDPYTQNIYLQVNQIPWLLRLFITSNVKFPENMEEEYNLYKKNCSSCHNEKRTGNYQTIDEKIINYVPSLIKIYNENYSDYNYFKDKISNKHNYNFKESDLIKIHNLFKKWDEKIFDSKNFNTNFQWSQFLYSDNLPVTKPPWGKIVSLNIIDGKMNWEMPSGYIKSKKIGTSNFGGLLATSAGIIFSTGTDDKKFVAIDSSNGKELWSYEMVASGSTAPITFELNKKQYVAVISTGGRYHNYSKKYGELYVFSLDTD